MSWYKNSYTQILLYFYNLYRLQYFPLVLLLLYLSANTSMKLYWNIIKETLWMKPVNKTFKMSIKIINQDDFLIFFLFSYDCRAIAQTSIPENEWLGLNKDARQTCQRDVVQFHRYTTYNNPVTTHQIV